MVAQPDHLIMEVTGEQFGVLLAPGGSVGLVVLGLAEIVVPLPLAAEPRHDQDALAVGQLVELLAAAPEPLEANGIEVHVPDVVELGIEIAVVLAQEQVIHPAAAANQDPLAVDGVATVSLLVEIVAHLANAEGDAANVARPSGDGRIELERIELGRA